MLKYNLLSRKFSQLAKIIFTKQTNNMKNVIYFATEGEMKVQANDVSKLINFVQPVVQNDIQKNKFGLLYSFPNNAIFSERLIYTEIPKNDLEKTRKMAAKAIRTFNTFKLNSLHVLFSKDFPVENRKIAINSLIQANYLYRISGEKPKSQAEKSTANADNSNFKDKEETSVLKEINIFNDSVISSNIQDFKIYASLANASLYTRELANMRPNLSNCDYLEEVAKVIADKNPKVKIEVIKGDELLKNNLNLVHAVGKGAESKPRIVILRYNGKPSEKTISHAIVGKGLTFDSGGLNLKPTNFIEDMYLDKHGACNALSTFKYAVDWNLPINLVCAVGLAENAIDGKSYKPSDIIQSYKGLTVEITNTDAEGRLVLADVLAYVQDKYKPKNIIDLATLTGACMIALGNHTAGLFTNNQKFAEELKLAAEDVMEPVWQLPIFSEHREDMKSKFADLKNAGKDRYGGASKGAAFLECFIDKDVNWIHLDIAGPSTSNAVSGIYSAGATGFGTQMVLKYLYNYAYPERKPTKAIVEENQDKKNEINDGEIKEEKISSEETPQLKEKVAPEVEKEEEMIPAKQDSTGEKIIN